MPARNSLRIENGNLIIVPKGMDKVWGFRKKLTVPLSSVTNVSVEPAPYRIPTGWRGPGLDISGKLVGTFHPKGERHYWNYSGTGTALSIRLDEAEHFRQLYLSVDDAEASRQLILQAAPSRSTK
ncbi:hypothetical protein BJ978_002461 [Agromyces terreus]|uniref:Bacterial Pleckstrin homology domain-containing protein n=1 Tax=Agromyces terreus TaxID=424795 RepID=A0A9X2KD00_9MICO|nr:hypothetical protein [Agromyces terreus]MCP2371785.1 hypothetical protein [Agromyces terreus]